MQFDEQRVQKGGNTRMKVVSNKVFSNKQLDEKKTRSAPFFSSKGDENLSNSNERGTPSIRYTIYVHKSMKHDEEIYEDRITGR